MRALFSLFLLAGWVTACDPEGPGARGSISLGKNVDPASYTTLAVAIFPDGKADLDPSAAIDATLPNYLTESLVPATGRPQPAMLFPYQYELGEPLGTTPDQDWRMVAWLSRTAAPTQIVTGDVFCSARFHVRGCGLAGGHCGVTTGVDCTLDQVRP